jgi:N-acetylmuramate 1-kinase
MQSKEWRPNSAAVNPMATSASGGWSFPLVLTNEQATRRLAIDVAQILVPGDIVTLSGDLGAGKTTFARVVIRHLANDPSLEVPSPTFTLLQTYALPRFPIVHADFYRLSNPNEVTEIGFDEAARGAAVLIEWPDRAGAALAIDRLDIALTLTPRLGPNYRHARISGMGTFAPRAQRLVSTRRFLDESGYADAERYYLKGDASTRTYERLVLGPRRVVLMNAPPRSDGPPVRNGLPYSAIAHLAEDVRPFVALARGLRERGLSAPEIHAADLAEGFLLLEDLGAEGIVADNPPVPIAERYAAAVDAISALHKEPLPTVLPVAPNIEHVLPPYDIDAFLIEAELLLDWYVPHLRVVIADSARSEFLELWRMALARAVVSPRTWVLRDFHSPNLLWLPDRDGIARVGLLDFQDALLGPPAYDVVSLLQDARIDVPEALELALLGRYAVARRAVDPDFDPARFAEDYATLGAHRATKVLGIFARLHRRDGRPQYLHHLPRAWRYLHRSLAHASLAPLKAWYDAHIPAPAVP